MGEDESEQPLTEHLVDQFASYFLITMVNVENQTIFFSTRSIISEFVGNRPDDFFEKIISPSRVTSNTPPPLDISLT